VRNIKFIDEGQPNQDVSRRECLESSVEFSLSFPTFVIGIPDWSFEDGFPLPTSWEHKWRKMDPR